MNDKWERHRRILAERRPVRRAVRAPLIGPVTTRVVGAAFEPHRMHGGKND